MKIALFHNAGGGGAKRALYEHARQLKARGHSLDLYIPSAAQEEYLPLPPLCDNVYAYDGANAIKPAAGASAGGTGGRARQVFKTIFGETAHDLARDAMWTRKRDREAAALYRVYEVMGRDMARGGYDLIYAHQCGVFLAPAPLFQAIRAVSRVPLVFYCADTLRQAEEWTASPAPDYDSRKSAWLRRRRQGRIVTPLFTAFQERRQEIYRDGLRRADLVLANSYYSREGFLRTAGIAARVCYLGADAAFFCPDPATPRKREVLSVGALRPEKRHGLILNAVGQIPTLRRPALRIIGYGWGADAAFCQELTERAQRLGVALHIETEVSDERVREAYRQCAVVAFAPFLEPFGLVTLEAMACGTPVVGVAEGGLRETIRPDANGLLVEAEADELSAALDSIVHQPDFAARLGAQGRIDVCERWTWERSADRLETLLQKALSKGEAKR